MRRKRHRQTGILGLLVLLSFFAASAEEQFLVDIEIPPMFAGVQPGDSFFAQPTLKNLRPAEEPLDVRITYTLLDPSGKALRERTATKAVHTTLTETAHFTLPPTATAGRYIVLARIDFGTQTVMASDTLDVVSPSLLTRLDVMLRTYPYETIFTTLAIFLLLFLLYLFYLERRTKLIRKVTLEDLLEEMERHR